MKRIILILIVFLCISCTIKKYTTSTIYEQTYPANTSEQEILQDVYISLDMYNIDSIPINKWIVNSMSYDKDSIKQFIIRQKTPEEEYTFIITKFTKGDTISYKYLIRENSIKNKSEIF